MTSLRGHLAQKAGARNRFNGRLFVAGVLVAFYSFGTFGLLNLFDLRTAGQILSAWLLVMAMAVSNTRVRTSTALAAGTFFSIYALGGIARTGAWVYPVEGVMGLAVWVVVLSAPFHHVTAAAKALVVSTTALALGLAVAYTFYLTHPDWLLSANFNTYDSTTGSAGVAPVSFLDYLSFTSGDGFVARGHILPRLKGYSNEPSATLVHYFAPALVALFLGGRYLWLGALILLVNLVAIASVTSYLVLAGGLLLVLGFRLPRRVAPFVIVGGAIALVMFLLDSTALSEFQITLGQQAIDVAETDLLARKSGSLATRQEGLAAGLQNAVAAPLGWSGGEGIAGAGVLVTVSAFGGWIGVGILVAWCVRVGRLSLDYAKKSSVPLRTAASAFFVALLFVALFVSGYGWNRVPGVIMMAILSRLLSGEGVKDARVSLIRSRGHFLKGRYDVHNGGRHTRVRVSPHP